MSSRLSSPARSRAASLTPTQSGPMYLASRSRSNSVAPSITSIASGASSVVRGPSKSHLCHISVRVRPPNELDKQKSCIWNVDEDEKTISLVPEYAASSSRRRIDEYPFDSVFLGSDNYKLYQTAVYKSVLAALEGLNSVVFAYGQTASGKTYTMIGSHEEPGMIPQAVEDIFEYIKQCHDREFLLKASYLEIYNETIRDLLAPEQKNLRIVEHPTRGMIVSPLREEIVTSAKQLMKIIRLGESNRQVEDTDYNLKSSRSHSIFQVLIESRKKSLPDDLTDEVGSNEEEITVSQLNLIDLAGSEKGNSDHERRKEGSFINRSLLTLGSVIHKLTRSGTDHIPFRDSKLTRILQPALAGNGRLCVLATISPCGSNIDESLNTLKFASRARKMVPRVEYIPAHVSSKQDQTLLNKYKQEIEKLRQSLVSANQKLEKEKRASFVVGGAGLNMEERRQYEEQLLEAGRSKNALKERIQHLTKLILSSSQTGPKSLIDGESNSMTQGLSGTANQSSLLRRKSRGSIDAGLKPSTSATTAASLDSLHHSLGLHSSMSRDLRQSSTMMEDMDAMKDKVQKLNWLIHKIDMLNEQDDVRRLIQAYKSGRLSIDSQQGDGLDPSLSSSTSSLDPSEKEHLLNTITAHVTEIESLKKKLEEADEFMRFSEKDQNVLQELCEQQDQELGKLQKENQVLKSRIVKVQAQNKATSSGSPFSKKSLSIILDVMYQHMQQYEDSEVVNDSFLQCIQELTQALE